MQYKLVMFLSKVACHTPYRLLMAVGWVLGNLYYLLIKKERERAVSQMMPALGIEEPEARHLVQLSFINLARNVLEILYMPHLSEKNFGEYIEIDHLERLTDALAEGHGVAIVTGHIGTWEWLSAAFTLNGLPVTAIAKPQPNMQYTYALNDLRKTIHVEIFSRFEERQDPRLPRRSGCRPGRRLPAVPRPHRGDADGPSCIRAQVQFARRAGLHPAPAERQA